jgi:hypothetical protein
MRLLPPEERWVASRWRLKVRRGSRREARERWDSWEGR